MDFKRIRFKFASYLNLKRKITHCENNQFQEKRDSSSLLLEDNQYVYDLWIENSIPSVDFRNERYAKYEHLHPNLKNGKHPVKEKIKCGFKVYVAAGRVAKCTI